MYIQLIVIVAPDGGIVGTPVDVHHMCEGVVATTSLHNLHLWGCGLNGIAQPKIGIKERWISDQYGKRDQQLAEHERTENIENAEACASTETAM